MRSKHAITANIGIQLVSKAILAFLRDNPSGMTHAEIVNELDIHTSSVEGEHKNWFTWGILQNLCSTGDVVASGERRSKVYFYNGK